MQRYNIADLMRRAGKRSANVILPPITERLSMQRSYLAVMRRLIKALSREIVGDVLVRYGQLVGRYTQDADAQSFDRLKRIAERLVSIAQETVDRILILESQKHTEQFIDVARKTLGIDVSAVVKQEDIGEYLDLAARRNADLIKSQTDTMIRRIEQATLQNILAGNPVSALRKKFIDEFGIADRKAKLLARDQSSKLTSDLNRIRQTQAGIEEYEWMTAHDERVRPLHRSIDGKKYEWGKPTGAEQGLPPGQPIQCFLGSNRFFADHSVKRFFRYFHTVETSRIVTESGITFDATANHPMLTNTGWKPVHAIQVGDYIIQAHPSGFFRSDVDIEQRYARFDDLFNLFRSVSHVTRKGMRGDLYGDPVVNEQIEIVETESMLLDDIEAKQAQEICKFVFQKALVSFADLSHIGDFDLALHGNGSIENGLMRVMRELEAFCFAQATHANGVGRTAIASVYADTVQMIRDCFPLASESLRQSQHAFATHIKTDHFVAVELGRIIRLAINVWQREVASFTQGFRKGLTTASEFGGNSLQHFPGTQFTESRVKQVVTKRDSHFVYTSETEFGWYLTNSAVAGNCRCVARGIVKF